MESVGIYIYIYLEVSQNGVPVLLGMGELGTI